MAGVNTRPIIYDLQLQHNCRYIGTTRDFKARMLAHESGKGAVWTTLHKPIRLVRTETRETDEEARALESIWCAKLCLELGWERVRGGPFCFVTPTPSQLRAWSVTVAHLLGLKYSELTNQWLGEQADSRSKERGACFRCGRKDHWANNCFYFDDITGRILTAPRRGGFVKSRYFPE